MTSAKQLIPALTAILTLGVACTSSPKPAGTSGVVETTTTTLAPAGMTFAECQASAEYPGGRYAVDYDNGVCNVQKPAEVAPVVFSSCADAAEKGFVSMRRGEPGYNSNLDRDGDGVACDS